jgi:translation initiation factor eIF-2B subunit alpha
MSHFTHLMNQNADMSAAVAAIKTLLEFIRLEPFSTLTELREKLLKAIDTLTKSDASAISIKSGCEMLLRFITLTAGVGHLFHHWLFIYFIVIYLTLKLDAGMEKCKELLLQNGEVFLEKARESRSKIARIAYPWIPNGAVIS